MKKREKSVFNLTLFIDTNVDATKIVVFAGNKILKAKEWRGGGDLSETLLSRINKLLGDLKLKLSNLNQIAVFSGPGSYTGLRIGITVANFLAWSLNIPIVAAETVNNELFIIQDRTQAFILPKYLKSPHITKPKI